jgi:hypothetical protein
MILAIGIYAVTLADFGAFLFGLSRTPRRAENNSRLLGPLVDQMLSERADGDWPSVVFDFSDTPHATPSARKDQRNHG